MSQSSFPKSAKEVPVLRDHLADNRTVLSNERTFLAYMRTALSLFAVGVTFVKFFGHVLIEIVGWVLIPSGVLVFIIGFIKYKRMKNLIKEEADLGGENRVATI
jgi:putative membrane protein